MLFRVKRSIYCAFIMLFLNGVGLIPNSMYGKGHVSRLDYDNVLFKESSPKAFEQQGKKFNQYEREVLERLRNDICQGNSIEWFKQESTQLQEKVLSFRGALREPIFLLGAIYYGHIDAFRYFVSRGLSVHEKYTSLGLSILHRVVLEDIGPEQNFTFLDTILSEIDQKLINTPDALGVMPIHLAMIDRGSERGALRLDFIEVLCKHSANINAQDKDGNTPLHHAMFTRKSPKVVKLLRQYGADMTIKNNKGEAPNDLWAEVEFFAALRAGDVEDLMATIREKDVNEQVVLVHRESRLFSNQSCFSMLHGVIDYIGKYPEYIDVVRVLVDRGADLNVRDKSGRTALHNLIGVIGNKGPLYNYGIYGVSDVQTCQMACKNVLDLLLSRMSKETINAVDNAGRTVLHMIAHQNRSDKQMIGNAVIAEQLLSYGADASINVQDDDGNTPLHYAAGCWRNSGAVFDLLVKWPGVDRTIRNNDRKTADDLLEESLPNRMIAVARAGDVAELHWLLDKGVTADMRLDLEGNTSLHYVCNDIFVRSKNTMQMIDALIANDVDIDVQNNRGETPLHTLSAIVQCLNHPDGAVDRNVRYRELFFALKALLEHGADLTIENNAGKTAQSIWERRGEFWADLPDQLDSQEMRDWLSRV